MRGGANPRSGNFHFLPRNKPDETLGKLRVGRATQPCENKITHKMAKIVKKMKKKFIL
jgi:hypothetical protein